MTDETEDKSPSAKDGEAVDDFMKKASKDSDPLALARDRFRKCERNKIAKGEDTNRFETMEDMCPNLRVTDPSKETVFEGRVRLTLRCQTCGIEEVVLARFHNTEKDNVTDDVLETINKVREERRSKEDPVEEFFRRTRGG